MAKPNANTDASKNGEQRQTASESLQTILGAASAKKSTIAEPAMANSVNLLARKKVGEQALVEAVPVNLLKAAEFGLGSGHAPQAGKPISPDSPLVTASTVTESRLSAKLGKAEVKQRLGDNALNTTLDAARVDASGQALTTNMGLQISDNQNSLKAGLRGPTLLEDFVLREKITHFDHERIPERIVHARGSAAHGYFECYTALDKLTKAAPFAESGKRTPVFVRFSTVAGERGSADLARDVRGFAVKFYTDAGNWDIVGNNIPVFFIQDAMKFPDLIHAVKPEPNNQMPQAASAHDTFWDFVSLMPESTHTLMWAMSDRAIPRSLRMMQGFGVHTFRLVNAAGEAVFCKFHWNPIAGTHSVTWDEAVKINGADPDFHRRDLWDAIEAGAYPAWELGLQVFSEAEAEQFSFDVLDATKLIPEELIPVQPVGRMVLNRNPDNFFAETEQVAFGTANIIPGIDFSNDPLLSGRHHSYLDTQLSRLGGPNFHELPINASLAPVHNNQRDGIHRQSIIRGRVAYEPNSLGGGCPFQAGMKGYVTFPQPVMEDKVRGKPEKFADHFSQATLFWNSQTPIEQKHIIGAFRFELTKVQVPAIRVRTVSMLANVSMDLASKVAEGLDIDMPPPMPRVLENPAQPEITQSAQLSLFARPGDGSIQTRQVAIIVSDGIDAGAVKGMQGIQGIHAALLAAGAVPKYIGESLGDITASNGERIAVEVTFEATASVLWDAVVLPAYDMTTDVGYALADSDNTLAFIKEQYRHCKLIVLLGNMQLLHTAVGARITVDELKNDPSIIFFEHNPLDGSDASSASAKNKVGSIKKDKHAITKKTFGKKSAALLNQSSMALMLSALGKHRNFYRELCDKQ
jgi:catalase